MLLTIDIGNTNVLMGVFEDERLRHHWRLVSKTQRTSDEWGSLLLIQFQRVGIDLKEVTDVIVSSVVPSQDSEFARMVSDYLGKEVIFVHLELDIGITISYHDAKQVGADRLCNAVAALMKYEAPIIIIDFGTATTYDILIAEREYFGGVISPGVETAALILHKQAAKLPLVGMKFPKKVIGQTTENSIQSGILYGALVETEGLIRLIQEEVKGTTTVIGTGGHAELFASKTKMIQHVEPFLTLEGLRAIYQRIR